MTEIFEALQWLVDWFGSLKEAADVWFEQALIWLAAWYIETKIWVLEVVWDFASAVIDSFNLSGLVNSAFASVDSRALLYINYFRVVDCINVVLNACVTRFLLSMIGW